MTGTYWIGHALLNSNDRIGPEIYEMELVAPEISSRAKPGQFVMASLSEEADPYLRRPFSIAGADRGRGVVKLIYQAAGKGTAQMSRWAPGRQVGLMGPLGNGFSWREEASGSALAGGAILIGGGIGAAPLLPLAKSLREQNISVSVFIGVKTIGQAIGLRDFHAWGCRVRLATEDGSGGMTGLVTLPLEQHLKASAHSPGADTPAPRLFACGPAPLLRAVAALGRAYALEAQLSMEERMGCGFGVCMGCSIKTMAGSGGFIQKRVCHDGPVFDARVVFYG